MTIARPLVLNWGESTITLAPNTTFAHDAAWHAGSMRLVKIDDDEYTATCYALQGRLVAWASGASPQKTIDKLRGTLQRHASHIAAIARGEVTPS